MKHKAIAKKLAPMINNVESTEVESDSDDAAFKLALSSLGSRLRKTGLVGESEGDDVGSIVGEGIGDIVGVSVGDLVGIDVGSGVGDRPKNIIKQ